MKSRVSMGTCICACLLSVSPAHSQLQWNRTNGPTGGDVTALVMDHEGRLFAGTRLGGIYRSLDNGGSWSRLEPNLLYYGVWDFAVNSSGDVFAATSNGVYRSTDGGDTWTVRVPGHSFVECVAVNADDVVFAGTRGGVFHSDDNGQNWSGTNTGLTNTFVQGLFISDEGDLFAATMGGVFFSSDGDQWEERNAGLTNLNTVEVFAIGPDTVFAGTYDGLFRSIDGGHNWTRHVFFDLFRSLVRSDTGVLYGGGNGVFYHSDDGGETWLKSETDDLTFTLIDELTFDADGNLLAATYEDGVLRSNDGGDAWVNANDNLIATDIVSVLVSQGNVFAAGDNGVYRTSNGGQNWIRLTNGLPTRNIEALDVAPDGMLFASSNANGLYHSVNGGETWQAADTSLSSRQVRSVAKAWNGDIYAGDSEGRIFKSTDNAGSWELLEAGIPSTAVQAIGIGDGVILAGTSQNGIYRSTDEGATWSEANTGVPESYDITQFLFPPDGSILAAMFGGVFRSVDDGMSWQPTGNVPILGVKGIARDSNGNLYIAMRGGGIASSSDDAQTWMSDNNGFAHLNAAAVMVDEGDKVFGGTRGGGVFAAQAVATAVEDQKDLPARRTLLTQNYPNPFVRETTISYRLEKPTIVEVRVLNALGQTVRVLVTGEQRGGDHTVKWDGTDANGAVVSAGLYLYRVNAGGHVQTHGMLHIAG